MRKTIILYFAALVVALSINATPSAAIAADTYVVKPGDSLFSIAQRFQTTANAIANTNSLHNTTIYPGQALALPTKNAGTQQNSNYIVQPGDTLFLIGQKYGVSYSQLQQANGLSTSEIYPGQSLVIPRSGVGSQPEGQAQVQTQVRPANNGNYVVQPGDTLYLISRRYGITVARLQALNGLTGAEIYVGQNLKVPSQEATTQASRGNFSWRDIELIARVVTGEARGECYEGQVAVAAVILNRLESSSFPTTIAGVIYQPLAFTAVADGQINLPCTSSARKAVTDAVNGWDPTSGALYYWNPVTATSKWIWSRPITSRIGNHVFAK